MKGSVDPKRFYRVLLLRLNPFDLQRSDGGEHQNRVLPYGSGSEQLDDLSPHQVLIAFKCSSFRTDKFSEPSFPGGEPFQIGAGVRPVLKMFKLFLF